MSDKLNIFGKSHNVVGESSSDLILKCRGSVKVQWGNKFIDIIKDGKINVDSKFIFSVNSVNDIKSKNGLYITSDGSVYLRSNESVINLSGEIGTVYVSYMAQQETTSDQKYTALKNIGLIYDDISSINDSSLRNGIVYIVGQQKLYIINNGQMQEYQFQMPNPFSEQFIISKNDASQGALVIRGSGINNSLAFDTLFLYTDENVSYIDSDGDLVIRTGGNQVIRVDRDNTIINNAVSTECIQSIEAGENYGFKLYTENGESWLIVDNIIERNATSEVDRDTYPQYYSLNNNIIVSAEFFQDETYGDTYILQLKYQNTFKVGDCLYAYAESTENNTSELGTLVKIPLKVIQLNVQAENGIQTQVIPGVVPEADALQEMPNFTGKIIYLAGTDEQIDIIRYTEKDIDLLQYTNFEDEQKPYSVKARTGNLEELQLNMIQDKQEIPVDGVGIYSEKGLFREAMYDSEYVLEMNDDSSRFASTEWVNRLLPVGSIIMFGGSQIPEGWQVCNGSNGTPNLSGYFIKGGSSTGSVETYKLAGASEEGDQSSIVEIQSCTVLFIMRVR